MAKRLTPFIVMDLTNKSNPQQRKVIFVTGGSRGIGAATAILAAQKGYTVCINYKENDQSAQTIVKHITNDGGKAIAFRGDVSKETDVKQWFETIDKEAGPIDALVNNAGILETRARTDEMNLERWQRVFAVNTFGCFLCTREAIKRMSTKYGGNGGAIVNVSSAAARLGGSFEFVDYGASKGAVDTMTIGIANEVANEGVRINGIRPGLIDTEIHADSGSPNRVAQLEHRIPMKRGGTPEEVASAILWLLSEEASYITGTTIDVTGGR